MNKFQFQNSRGFTIIETLVAITVLMIAVAGPLVVASKGLNAALYARDQIIASYLAQESMEVIKNYRDNTIVGSTGFISTDWLNFVAPINGTNRYCTSNGSPCDASALISVINQNGASGGSTIYFEGGSGYRDDPTGSRTIFKRYYYITMPNSQNPCTSDSSECEARVVVTWNEGTVPFEVDLNSELVRQ